MKKAIACLLALALLCGCVALAQSEPSSYEDYEGDGLKVHVEQRKLDSTVYSIAWVTIASPDQFLTALAGEPSSKAKATVQEMAVNNHAVIAINGDFYTNRTTGYIVRNFEDIRLKPYKKYDLLVVDENADLHVIENSDATELKALLDAGHTVRHAFTFGPGLVKDGERMKINTQYGFAAQDNTAPRSAIGQTGPLSYVLVVADGRQSGYSQGATHLMMAELMVELGCETAYNLDGGASSALVFEGEQVNHYKNEAQREISDIIYFVDAAAVTE